MVDAYRLRSPLAHLGLEARAHADADISGTGVVMKEIPYRGLINIRGDAADSTFVDAVQKAVKLSPPVDANTVAGKASTTRIMWLGPDEWLVITSGKGAERALKALWKNLKVDGLHAAVTDSTHARTCIEISGPRAREVLQKGCSLDLHPRVFGPGRSAQCIVAKTGVMLTQTATARNGDPTYELYPLRSFATYLWTWLEDASAEYGLKVG
ncbi:MAG: sarcosine oxidase subunit gamma [Rhodospirillales bacterium]